MRPTVFGVVVGVLLVVGAALRPSVADPSVTGLVWAGLLGAFVFGVVWPIVTVRTVGLRIVAAPTDLVVAQLGTLELELTGRASGLALGATGSGTAVIDVVAPGPIRIPFTVARRGSYRQIRIDVASDAPFGVVHARRSRLVTVPHQLLVGPLVEPMDVEPGALPADMADPMPTGSGVTGDSVRSVRPYVSGDPAHLVHWPSSARTGTLVVRELEPPAADGIAIVVDLGGPDANVFEIESTASLAAGAAQSARARGARVVLCTCEASGPVAAEAPDELSVQRRLALAVPGAPAAPPESWPAVRVGSAPVDHPAGGSHADAGTGSGTGSHGG